MKAKKNNPQQSMSRRTFLTFTAKAAVGITVLPSHVISGLGHTSPSDKLNIAGIGIGGKGKANLAIRLQGLHKKLEWDGEKMEFKNIRPEESLQVVTSHEYKKVEGRPRFHTDHKTLDAYQSAREWVRPTYRDGWEWDR